MGQHGDQVRARFGTSPLLPKPHEIFCAFLQLRHACLALGGRHIVGHTGGGIGPVRELAALFPGKVEKNGQHLGGELYRHHVYPVEGLVGRQGVEDPAGAFANAVGQLQQVLGSDCR